MPNTRRRGARALHALLMLPALALGVLLLAVFIADHNGTSVIEVFGGDSTLDVTPVSLPDDTP